MRGYGLLATRYLLLIAGAVVFVLPLAWMLVTALKPAEQTMTMPPEWLPFAYTFDDSAEPVEVYVVGERYQQARDAGAASIEAQFAFQWVVEKLGEPVPVRVDDQASPLSGRPRVSVHWRSVRHDNRPVKVLGPLDDAANGDTLQVYVFESAVLGMPATASRPDLVLHHNTTADEASQSYSFYEEIDTAVDVLEKRYIPWGARSRLAFAHTQATDVPIDAIQRSVAPRWENFGEAIRQMEQFPRYLFNTLTLCLLTVVGTVASSAMVAYGFSRIDWPGRDRVFLVVLATMMIPFPVIMVPLYGLFRELGWIGTLRPLWVPAFFASAFNIFLLRQFFRTIPRDLSEAARIDGCGEVRIFLQIILPLAKPALAVVALFQFLATWNDFLGPLIYLTDQSDFTLALGLQFFQSQHGGTQWHLLMAASCLVVLPVIALFFLAQRTFVEGVSTSGLKG